MSLIENRSRGIVTLTILRQARGNALDAVTMKDLNKALVQLDEENSVRAIVITGEGDRNFCAGADLSEIKNVTALKRHEAQRLFVTLLQTLLNLRRPSIARLNGEVRGGGVGLALACDLIVSRPGLSFSTPEASLGLFPMMISTLLLRNLPPKRAMEMMLTGGSISVEEAKSLGLVSTISKEGTMGSLDEAVEALTQRIASLSPRALRLGKEALNSSRDMPPVQALAQLNAWLTLCRESPDATEGLRAFQEKRPPSWPEE